MSKAKKLKVETEGGKTTISGTAEDITNHLKKVTERLQSDDQEKTINITSASLKDLFCNYTYEFTKGIGAGDNVNRKGAAIIHDDLKAVFKKFHPHLAVICEEIDKDDISDIEDIEDFDDEKHKEGSLEHRVSHFSVSAVILDGTGENESVRIIGSKRLSTGDYVELKSPKTLFSGGYQFVDELRVAVDDLLNEVEEYMNGKAAPKMVQGELPMGEGEENYAEIER